MDARCPRPECGGTKSDFELKPLEVRGSNVPLYAIQCTLCGAVIAVVEGQ